ncbi:MAG: metallopeptidase family protein [Minisyncoccales bacterium]
MLEKDFEKLVKKAIVRLPQHIQKKMDNVAIVVKKRPSQYELEETGTKIGGMLLGLYQGVPKTAWGRGFGMILPDKITIFQDSIEQITSSQEEIKELVKIVVWHEIAHHFGFSEKQIRSLETKWKKR